MKNKNIKRGDWYYVDINGNAELGQVLGIIYENTTKICIMQMVKNNTKNTFVPDRDMLFKHKDPSIIRRIIKFFKG